MVKNVASAMSVSPEDYLNSTLKGQPPESQRTDIIRNMKVYPEGASLTDGQVNYLVSHWEEIRNVRRSDELSGVFMNVSNSGAMNLLIITRDAGIIYTLHEGSLVYSGMISGSFNPDEIMRTTSIRTVEPEFRDIVIGSGVYHVISE